MRVLVTGGAGLVGSHAAEYYARKGDKVIVLDNLRRSQLFGYDEKSVEYNWHYLAEYKNIERMKGDVREEKDVLSALGEGVDVVIHAAGQPGVPPSVRKPKEDFSINALGTLTVLEGVRKICPRATFIYCSTNKVYGENVDEISLKELETRYSYKDREGISEEMPIDRCGHTPYGASKYVGDLYTQEYAYIYGMKTAVFRMSCIYGTRQFGFEDQGWVAWFIIAALTGKPITIYGNGKQVRDLLYAEDLIEAYDKFIKSDSKHAVFNIGGGPENTLSLLEFLEVLEKETGKRSKLVFRDWRPSDQKVYISEISKVRERLGWAPKISPREGVKRLVEWVRDNKRIF
ncbi:MAG: NAD-dependent epimerase/dehydratase family protein [Nitrospirae bacterium]|nr:NAD-dependent epimerase/dehydratase family protein [Nitrospirota bacterium]